MIEKEINENRDTAPSLGKLIRPEATAAVLQKYNFMFQKKFGQNFLIDSHVLAKIITAADITKDDIVLEVGPGIGTMTQALCENAMHVVAVEIDKNLIPVLTEDTLADYDNVTVVNNDILKVDIPALIERVREEIIRNQDKAGNENDKVGSKSDTSGSEDDRAENKDNKAVSKDNKAGSGKIQNAKVKVVANLPYYITTPIIMGLLEGGFEIENITVMVQKEVAMRMQAGPGSKDYGALSLAVQYYAVPYLAANVPRNCFMPRPNVDSAVIRLTRREVPPVKTGDADLMFKFIRASFNQRRKTLINGLRNAPDIDITREEAEELLISAGFSPTVRGEELDLAGFASLTDAALRVGTCHYVLKLEGKIDSENSEDSQSKKHIGDSIGFSVKRNISQTLAIDFARVDDETAICRLTADGACFASAVVTVAGAHSICLSDVYTNPDKRRQGYAEMLIGAIRDEFAGKDILLHTDSTNAAAIKLYKKLGFKADQSLYTHF